MRQIQLSTQTQVAMMDLVPRRSVETIYTQPQEYQLPKINTMFGNTVLAKISTSVGSLARQKSSRVTLVTVPKNTGSIKICGRVNKTVRGNKER